MRQIAWMTIFLLVFCPFEFAALGQEEQPDREMLRIMELLEKWEILNHLETVRQLEALEQMEKVSPERDSQKSSSEEKEEQK